MGVTLQGHIITRGNYHYYHYISKSEVNSEATFMSARNYVVSHTGRSCCRKGPLRSKKGEVNTACGPPQGGV